MDSYRNRITRCPRLGDEIPFSYCEKEAGGLPCRQVVRCWGAVFPVEALLRETLGDAVWERFSSQVPKERLATLLEIVEAAQRRRKKDNKAG